ncbi:MAG: DUF1959 domain-containing protein [Methanobrevibacter sp.]|nr:DUF1959 domain-containing protein [Methanobrevibacter sp.]
MNDDERLTVMKQRIVRSFRWHDDIIVPMADEFGISVEEMEDLFMNALDMSSLESLHSTFDSAKFNCLRKQLYIDLRLCWFAGGMELITYEEAEDIQNRLASEVYMHNKPYDEALEEGRKEILEILKNTSVKEE